MRRAVARRHAATLAVVLALAISGCAAARPVMPTEPAPGTLLRAYQQPAGPGPFPAVVLLHTCGGVAGHLFSWARILNEHGYAALIVDSFGPRGGRPCGVPSFYPATLDEVTDDAFRALAWLRARPGVEPDRIGVMGFSYGASASLRTSSARYRRGVPGGGFRAAVAFYPLCVSPRPDWPSAAQERSNNLHDDVVAPTLVLMGEEDRDTPDVATNCARTVARLRRSGRPVDIRMYPGAGHVFDVNHAAATRAARADMLAFFDRHVRGGSS